MNTKLSQSRLDSIILFLALILANLRATMFVFLHPDTSEVLGPAWIEILLWLVLAIAVLYHLTRSRQILDYLSMWGRNWLLALFILLTFVSMLWSIGPVVTFFRALELFLATLVASYVGLRMGPERTMEALFWFGALLFILSIALANGAPPTGTMYWPPFYGAWRGVYWHRNHLASITTLLGMVYFCRMLIALQGRNGKGVLDGFFYLVSLMVLYFARSATGYILVIVLHTFIFAIWIWLRIYRRLHTRQYILILGIGALIGVLVLSNLDFVFGLFQRDTSLTGRVSLWSHLIDMASQRMWFGHGFGAVWTFDSFRETIRQQVAWTSQPLIADNGLLDIFLHLGIPGVVVFSFVLILGTVRSLLYGVRQKTLTGFFPLLVMVYAFFANITFSLFAETEVFLWFLIVAALFMTTPSSDKAITS